MANGGDDCTGTWLKDAPWSIGGKVATNTPSPIAAICRPILSTNQYYLGSFQITAITAQPFYMKFGSAVIARTSTVTYLETRYSTNAYGGVHSTAMAAGSIDNVSYKRLTRSTLCITNVG